MQVELQDLWTEQVDHLKKRKEHCATEVRQKLKVALLTIQFSPFQIREKTTAMESNEPETALRYTVFLFEEGVN